MFVPSNHISKLNEGCGLDNHIFEEKSKECVKVLEKDDVDAKFYLNRYTSQCIQCGIELVDMVVESEEVLDKYEPMC